MHRSPHTVNRELRSIGTVLTYVRRLGLLPRLPSDDVSDGLQKLDLEALDPQGNAVGEITPQGGSQTKRTGVIGLEISPALRKLLATMNRRGYRLHWHSFSAAAT